jgi:hypothetical protein
MSRIVLSAAVPTTVVLVPLPAAAGVRRQAAAVPRLRAGR